MGYQYGIWICTISMGYGYGIWVWDMGMHYQYGICTLSMGYSIRKHTSHTNKAHTRLLK